MNDIFLRMLLGDVVPSTLISHIDFNIPLVNGIDAKSVMCLKAMNLNLDKDLILIWLHDNRPDLYSIILNNTRGIHWLEDNIEIIKGKIL